MSYFAGHMKKLKRADLKWSQIHNQREKESKSNRDIDKSRSHLNYDLANDGKVNYQGKIDKRLKEGLKPKARVRKDSVLCNSWVITSDKGFFDRIGEQEEKRFFREAYKWFCDRYGEENIAYAMVHKDEHTPHMHLGVIPITKDKRLSSKDLFNRKELLYIQEEFPKFIQSRGFNLERGIPGKQEHIEPTRWKNLKTLELGRKLDQGVKQMKTKQEQIKKVLEKEVAELKEVIKQKRKLEQELKPLTELQEQARNIYNMEEKPVGFMGIIDTERVKVRKEDWEGLKQQALQTARLQTDNHQLQQRYKGAMEHLERIGHELQEARKQVVKMQELAGENKELKERVDELELKLDLIEQELNIEFELEWDDGLELDDEEDSPKRRRRGSSRRAKLKARRRPKDRPFGRHQQQRWRQQQQRKRQQARKRGHKQIDRGKY